MSKKTMKQRIALVAVSALTAGLFSVVSAPVANAAADATFGSLWLATTNSSTGATVATTSGGDTALDKNVGFVSVTSANVAVSGTSPNQVVQGIGTGVRFGGVGTAVALNTAQLRFNTAATTATTGTFHVALVVSGGSWVASSQTSAGGAMTFNGTNTVVRKAADAAEEFAATAVPASGATTMTVSAYEGTTVTTDAPTTGTLMGRWVITIVAAGSTGTFSPSLSPVAITTSATAAQITSSADASISGVTAGNPLFIQVIGNNVYGSALAAGTYVATATNGATVAWGNAAAATAAGTISVATVTPDGTDQLRIDPASSLTTTTTTVTITHDGLPVATKNLTFYGEVKKIVIEKVVPGLISTTVSNADSATAYAVYSYRDSADGKVPGAAATFVATTANSTITNGVSARSPSRSTQAKPTSNMSDAVETLIGTGTDGIFAFTCGSTPKAADGTITHTNAITGTALTATATGIGCYGPLATYTVSTDKAKYAVGEIATITILGKDVLGNPVPDSQTLAANSISVGGGSLAVAVAATDVFTAGKAEYKAQMTTAGTFNTVVSLAGSTTTSATAGYSVTSGDVTNAAVLQSIVALIASINKQIAALQKLILARR